MSGKTKWLKIIQRAALDNWIQCFKKIASCVKESGIWVHIIYTGWMKT